VSHVASLRETEVLGTPGPWQNHLCWVSLVLVVLSFERLLSPSLARPEVLNFGPPSQKIQCMHTQLGWWNSTHKTLRVPARRNLMNRNRPTKHRVRLVTHRYHAHWVNRRLNLLLLLLLSDSTKDHVFDGAPALGHMEEEWICLAFLPKKNLDAGAKCSKLAALPQSSSRHQSWAIV